MHEWQRNGAPLGLSTSSADMLVEERSSLQLIIDTINATFTRYRGGRKGGGGAAMLSGGDHGTTATEEEVVELLGMFPQVLQSAIAPRILELKEQHRCSTAFDGVARPPPLSRQATLYRLLFNPHPSPSSLLSDNNGVLECIARVLMHRSRANNMEKILSEKTHMQHGAAVEPERPVMGESIIMEALRSLEAIVQLCVHDETNEEIRRSSSYNSRVSASLCDGHGNDNSRKASSEMLRNALCSSLCNLGLAEHLWHSVLFQPIVDAQRVATVRILHNLSRADVLRLPVMIARTQYSIAPALWGERVAECILIDPVPDVKGYFAEVLCDAFCATLGSADVRSDHNDVHWRRWLTNTSVRYLLGVIATGSQFSVLQPTLAILLLALEHEQLEIAGRHRQSERHFAGNIDLVGVVEVCSTALVHFFTGPDTMNSQLSGEDELDVLRDGKGSTKECHMPLRTRRLFVLGVVRLLRLALRGVDVLLDAADNDKKSHRSSGARNALGEASLLLRTCVEKQVMPAVLKCLEKRLNGCECRFATSTMRAEMVRLLRDLTERASPPLFSLSERLLPYLPLMLQTILDAGINSSDNVDENGVDELLPRGQLHAGVSVDWVEVVSLLGMLLLHSPKMREHLVEIIAALQCTLEQRWLLFNVMERVVLSLPACVVRDLLIIDAAGTVMNDPSRYRWLEGQLQHESIGRILQKQEMGCGVRKELNGMTPEVRWLTVQRQRQQITQRHIDVSCVLLWFVLHSLRKNIVGENPVVVNSEERGNGNEDQARGSFMSPIRANDDVATCAPATAPVRDLHRAASPALMSPRCGSQGFYCSEGDEDVAQDERESDVQWLQGKFGIHLSQLPVVEQKERRKTGNSVFVTPFNAGRNAADAFDRVGRRQLETIAAEERAYQAALGLFATLASRYYRHLLTPQVALDFLRQQQLLHDGGKRTLTVLMGNGNKSRTTTLRLWSARDVRQEDLFLFALPVHAITEAALLLLLQQARQHQEALRRRLLTTPQTPRTRRWFLEDAAGNIMGRLIALLQILLQHVQRKGERVVQETILLMPAMVEDVGEKGKSSLLQRMQHNSALYLSEAKNTMPIELHCGTLLEMVKLVVQCFSQPSDPRAECVAETQHLRGNGQKTTKTAFGMNANRIR